MVVSGSFPGFPVVYMGHPGMRHQTIFADSVQVQILTPKTGPRKRQNVGILRDSDM